jgi:hypothetical protein
MKKGMERKAFLPQHRIAKRYAECKQKKPSGNSAGGLPGDGFERHFKNN